MNNNKNGFLSVMTAYKIQQEHLKQWESILTPESAAKLRRWAESTNEEAKDGYDIRRGDDLSQYVFNNLMKK